MAEFDPSAYWTIPLVDPADTVALGARLLAAAPAPLPEELQRPVRRLRDAVVALEGALASQSRRPGAGATGAEKRAADHALDDAWTALHRRLTAWSYLPAASHAERAEAERLVAALFAEGLAFLSIDYEAEWAESERRLRQIEAEGLGGALERLAGRAFVDEVRRAHAAYGDALGLGRVAAPGPGPVDVTAPFVAVRAAARAYARRVVGLVDEDDDESVRGVTRALAPLAEVRAGARRRGS